MFYSAQILARKGPLGIVWIAAHHDKNYLKKQQVSGTNILDSCGECMPLPPSPHCCSRAWVAARMPPLA